MTPATGKLPTKEIRMSQRADLSHLRDPKTAPDVSAILLDWFCHARRASHA